MEIQSIPPKRTDDLWKKIFIDKVSTRRTSTRDRLGVKNERVQQGDVLSLKDPTSLTDEIREVLEQKHLDNLIDVHVVLDLFDGKKLKEKILQFLEFSKDQSFGRKYYN